jgi:hypothetical protein
MTVTETSAMPSANRRAVALAEEVLTLQEPWRSRFIDLICDYSFIEPGDRPSREEIAHLFTDRVLYNHVRSLLRVWAR